MIDRAFWPVWGATAVALAAAASGSIVFLTAICFGTNPRHSPPRPPTATSTTAHWGQAVRFSPDATTLLTSRCEEWTCDARLYAVTSGAEVMTLPALTAPHPSFSPEGHWVVAGGTLQHLPSGAARILDPLQDTTTALFAPNGDIIAGASDDSLTLRPRALTVVVDQGASALLPFV